MYFVFVKRPMLITKRAKLMIAENNAFPLKPIVFEGPTFWKEGYFLKRSQIYVSFSISGHVDWRWSWIVVWSCMRAGKRELFVFMLVCKIFVENISCLVLHTFHHQSEIYIHFSRCELCAALCSFCQTLKWKMMLFEPKCLLQIHYELWCVYTHYWFNILCVSLSLYRSICWYVMWKNNHNTFWISFKRN